MVGHQNKVYRLSHPFSPPGHTFHPISLWSLFAGYCALHCWISFGANISSLLYLYTLFSTKLSTQSSGVVSISAWKQIVQVKLLKISLVWCSAFIWTPRTPPAPRKSTTVAHSGKALFPGQGGTPLQEANRDQMCRWMGSHFHDWSDYNGVAFSIELLEWGRKSSDFGGR